MKRKRQRSAKEAEQDLEREKLRAEVVKLRCSGKSYREIGKALNITESWAFKCWSKVMERTIKCAVEDVEKQRMLSIQRLEKMLCAAEAMVSADDAPEHISVPENAPVRYYEHEELKLKAIDRITKIVAEIAKLTGQYAPMKTSLEVEPDAAERILDRLARLAAAGEEGEADPEPSEG